MSPEETASRWTYAEDELSAKRTLDDVTLTLTGRVKSRREPQPERRRYPGYPEWECWLTSLQFSLTSRRFTCEFEVERQNYLTTSGLREEKVVPYIVWRVNYPAMRVCVDGGSPKPVGELSFEDWLEFDMLFLGVYRGWPLLADEKKWRNYYREYCRIIYLQGGWLGGEWEPGFLRLTPNIPSSCQTKAANIKRTKHGEIPVPTNNWRYVAGEEPRIVNDKTNASLTYTGSYTRGIPKDDGRVIKQYWELYDFYDGKILHQLAVRIAYTTGNEKVMYFALSEIFLLSNGWSMGQINNAWLDKEKKDEMSAELERFALAPIAVARQVLGIFDALAHWPRVDETNVLPLIKATIIGRFKAARDWPFIDWTAIHDASLIKLFDFTND